jgi:hypothetical protein
MANDAVFKKYIKAEGSYVSHLRIELYYSLGGWNVFTHRDEPRGYYLSVTPVVLETSNGYTTESVTVFRGVKQLVKEVARRGAGVAKEAEKVAMSRISGLIDYVCTKENIKLLEEINING